MNRRIASLRPTAPRSGSRPLSRWESLWGWLRWSWLVLALSQGDPANAAEAMDPTARQRGLDALQAGRFDEARTVFRRSLTDNGQAPNTRRQAEAWFYLGLTDQQEAETASRERRRTALLQSSLEGYRRALAAQPGVAGVLNNLSKVQLALGKTNDALASLSQAVEQADARQGYYSEQYADLLLALGRWRDACQFYARVAGDQPGNRAVRQRMVDVCLERDRDLLVWYLWDLARRGQVSQVLDVALEVPGREGWTPALKDELMALVAHCLSRTSDSRMELQTSPAITRLGELESDPVIGPAATELRRLLVAGTTDAAAYSWWPQRSAAGREPPRGLWPADAFLALIRSLAERAASEGDPGSQEKLLLLAIGLVPGSPDPEALLELANVYSSRKQRDRIDDLMQRYEIDIFQGKGAAYTSSQVERIYRYHMALGVIYTQLGRFHSPRTIDSAEFQLTRALSTADKLNADAEREGRPPVVVPPRLVELLADGYAQAGKPEEAAAIRLTRAERYLALQQRDAAYRLLRPLRTDRALPRLKDEKAERLRRAEDTLREPPAPTPQLQQGTATDLRAKVEGGARTVAGAKGTLWLSDQEREAVETALNQMLPSLTATGSKAGDKSWSRSIPSTAIPDSIQEVNLDGRRGVVLLRQGTNLVEVPFSVPARSASSTYPARWVRP